MRYKSLGQELFIKNRKKYQNQVPSDSVSVFASNDFLPGNADGAFGFVQNSTFYYLTGIDQEDCYLILAEDGKELLFIKETSDLIRVWDGEKLSKEEAGKISGIKEIYWLSEFEAKLEEVLKDRTEVFLYRDTIQQSKFMSFRSKSYKLFQEIHEKYPLVEIRNSEKVIWELRLVKEGKEVEAIKRAIETTRKGFLRAAKFIQPGKYEYEVEAEISHEFTMNQSRRHAFMPIIASGKNSCVLHYIDNNKRIQENEVVLIDFGAEYANYYADITRVLPSSGKFTDRQAEVYTSVLDVLKATQELMVIGNTVNNLRKETTHLISKELIKLKLITEAELAQDEKVVLKYFPHGVSHSLGLDVHDVGDRETKFVPGMVLTCEPGIYIPEENIGIRLENDILITESGNINLSEDIPIEISDIEKSIK